MALTDEERNIRVNYIRPFLMPEGGQDIMKTNLKYVRDIKASVEARGYTIGEAGVQRRKQRWLCTVLPR